MITIIFGKPRAGKTALMTYLLTQLMFDRERITKMKRAIERLNAGGFNYSTPKHCVVSNYDIIGREFGYRPRISRRINPFRLGYLDETNPIYDGIHLLEPFTAVGITEGQKYFNSRKSMVYPDWQSRWFEQHGHNDYDVFIDVQRPTLIDVNIRELSCFIEIVEKKNIERHGLITGIKWRVRRIDGSYELDKYLASGKTDKSCYTEEIIKSDCNIHECYNSQMCRPKFYENHMHEDFDTREAELLTETKDGYIRYLYDLDDNLPKNFYQKRG